MHSVDRRWRTVGALALVAWIALAGCGGSESSDEPEASTTTTTADGDEDDTPDTTSSSTSEPETPDTTVDPALGFTPVPFRTASLEADAERLKDLFDASGITVDPYWGSCISIEFTGWDPDHGDVDVFVHQLSESPCSGDSAVHFYAIRNRAVTVEAFACGDCDPGVVPEADRYLAIRGALEGRPAVHGIVGGGARWSFDGFEEITLGTPTPQPAPQPAPSGGTVPASAYAFADWGGNGQLVPFQDAAFSTPSGNIVCLMAQDGTTCRATEHSWTLAEQDCGDITFSDYIAVSSRGVEKGMCVGGIMTPYGAKALPYGSALRYGGVTCSSAESGVTCTHDATGRGFTLSRAKLESF